MLIEVVFEVGQLFEFLSIGKAEYLIDPGPDFGFDCFFDFGSVVEGVFVDGLIGTVGNEMRDVLDEYCEVILSYLIVL